MRCALTAPFHPYPVYTRRFIFCCTFRGLTPPRRYLALCSTEPGLSSTSCEAATAQPTRRQRYLPVLSDASLIWLFQPSFTPRDMLNRHTSLLSKIFKTAELIISNWPLTGVTIRIYQTNWLTIHNDWRK